MDYIFELYLQMMHTIHGWLHGALFEPGHEDAEDTAIRSMVRGTT